MTIFDSPHFDGHEQVVFTHDKASGLKAIIAIHDTGLGPAVGGCRMWPYADSDAALTDVLRLSRGMSYKNAMAGLPLGGGKAVIIGDSRTDKTESLLRAFGRAVHALGGRYRTAEDVGMGVPDLDIIGLETSYALGRTGSAAQTVGDPSPFTARGGLAAIRAAVKHKLGRDSLAGLTIAIQGTGHVGAHLARLLAAEDALLLLSDIHTEAATALARETGGQVVAPDAILSSEADVIAPCALGAVLNDDSIGALKAPIVAGLANNQLAEARHATMLKERGILYAPDYVANAGGIIAVAAEYAGSVDLHALGRKCDAIGDTLGDIFRRADAANSDTASIADSLAREKLAAARKKSASADPRPLRRVG